MPGFIVILDQSPSLLRIPFFQAMLNEPAKESENDPIEIRCYFVRERNALLVRASFSPLYMDYYLHLMQHQIRYEPEWDLFLKDSLAALALHLASRPRNETTAWTVNLADPVLNLFVTGSNVTQSITGRVFSKNVRKGDRNLFFSQMMSEGQPTRQSTIEFDDVDFFRAVEAYYRQSEQRSARYFHFGDEEYVMVTAQPDCDMPWFLTLDDEQIKTIDQSEELSLLEKRYFRFDCGCDLNRIYPIIASLSESVQQELFAEQEIAKASCPRCGANYEVTRAGLEAFQSQRGS